MKKRILSMLLAVLMTASLLTGCGEKSSGVSGKADDTTVSQMPDTNDDAADSSPASGENESEGESASQAADPNLPEGVRPNGQIDELTDEELKYYAGILFRAAQALDTETLSLYADDQGDIVYLQQIKDDSQMTELWNKTVGQWIYFDADGLLLTKSLHYIEAKWYTDYWQSGVEIPVQDVEDYTIEDTLALYDKYYTDAPYEAILYTDDYYFNLWAEDGCLKFDVGGMLEPIDTNLSLCDICDFGYGFHPALLLFGASSSFSLGYDYIEKGFPRYLEFMTGDIDTIVNAILEDIPADEQNGISFRYLEQYFTSEEYHDITKAYMDENVEILRNLDTVYFFMPLAAGKEYPTTMITEETKAELEKYDVVTVTSMSKFPEYFQNNGALLYDIPEKLIALGLVERVY